MQLHLYYLHCTATHLLIHFFGSTYDARAPHKLTTDRRALVASIVL